VAPFSSTKFLVPLLVAPILGCQVVAPIPAPPKKKNHRIFFLEVFFFLFFK